MQTIQAAVGSASFRRRIWHWRAILFPAHSLRSARTGRPSISSIAVIRIVLHIACVGRHPQSIGSLRSANSDSPDRPLWLITVSCSVAKTRGEAVSDTVRTRPVKKLCVVILCGTDARYGAGSLHVRLDERDLETGLQGGYVGPVKRMRRQRTSRLYGLRATSRTRLVNGDGRVIDGTDV